MTIKYKRSHTAGAVPTTQDLKVEGQVAINTADGKVYARNDQYVVVEIGGLYSGDDLPTADPHLDGAFWVDNDNNLRVSAG